MSVVFDAFFYDFAVKMCADDPHFVFVFAGRKGKGAAHHAGTDYCYNCHGFLLLERLSDSIIYLILRIVKNKKLSL